MSLKAHCQLNVRLFHEFRKHYETTVSSNLVPYYLKCEEVNLHIALVYSCANKIAALTRLDVKQELKCSKDGREIESMMVLMMVLKPRQGYSINLVSSQFGSP